MPKATKESKYIEGIGRRKRAVARVRIYPDGKGEKIVVNDRPLKEYFPIARQQARVQAPFKEIGKTFATTVKVSGGGLESQADAVCLGMARALVEHKKEWREKLKPQGFLTRDPRMVERKKAGLRKARRPQQWRKR